MGIRRDVGKGSGSATDSRKHVGALLPAVFCIFLGLALLGGLVPLDGTTSYGMGYEAPCAAHPLGTDGLGRDVLARTLGGGSQLIWVALIATVASTLVGLALGFATAAPGLVCRGVAAVVDLLVVLPTMLVMMVLVYGLGSGVVTMVAVMCAVTAPYLARYVRSLVRPVLASDYVAQARLAGDCGALIMVREVLPVIAVPLLADTGQRFISAVYLVASASFLGFDALGSGADWGTMIQSGLAGLALNPWASLAPAIALACVTVPGNLLLDRLGGRGKL